MSYKCFIVTLQLHPDEKSVCKVHQCLDCGMKPCFRKNKCVFGGLWSEKEERW